MMRNILLIIPLLLVFNAAQASTNNLTAYSSGEVYYLGLVKVYDAALYVDEQERVADILNPLVSKCLELTYHVRLTTKDFVKSAEAVLSRQLSSQDLEKLKPHIELLHASYKPVEKGDRYRLCYQADLQQTMLKLNDEELVAIVSEDFSRAYFGIWLNPEKPLDRSLQEDLLSPPGKSDQED